MRSWLAQDAEAHFGELLEACLREGPQMVRMRGADAAVMVPAAEWRRLHPLAKTSLKDLLLADRARGEFNIPQRGRHRRRATGPIA